MDQVSDFQEYHPLCTPDFVKLPGTAMSPAEMVIKEELLEIIHWGNSEAPRTQQVVLGCSEAGSECDLQIAYKMANQRQVNFPDALKANMGTAFHTWLDANTRGFQQARGIKRWITETEVWPAKFLKGHVDLYDTWKRIVLDWKTTSAENLRLWKKEGIPHHYLVQIMLYGKGMINAGFPVERVGIIAINRSGGLRDIQVLTVAYDEEVALSALRKVWNIGKQLHELDVITHPQNYAKIPMSPSRLCGYCPFFRGGSGAPDGRGCPGYKFETDKNLNDLFG
jgi:hypothetical protein